MARKLAVSIVLLFALVCLANAQTASIEVPCKDEELKVNNATCGACTKLKVTGDMASTNFTIECSECSSGSPNHKTVNPDTAKDVKNVGDFGCQGFFAKFWWLVLIIVLVVVGAAVGVFFVMKGKGEDGKYSN